MSVAPYIKPIRLEGGTFYTFTEASDDLGFASNNSNLKFRFSKYALLNIPNIRNRNSLMNPIEYDKFHNDIQLDILLKSISDIQTAGNLNSKFAESFQNYCLNLETTITSTPGYNVHNKKTVAERVFFKWLKELGAIRFRNSIKDKEEVNNEGNSTEGKTNFFVEEDNSDYYNRLVQYIGDIDITNNLKNVENAYTEVYIHIPSGHGKQPYILFEAKEDELYKPGMSFYNIKTSKNYLFGRDNNLPSEIASLSTNPYYDSINLNFTNSDGSFLESWDEDNNTWINSSDPNFKWWYENPEDRKYILEPELFNDPSNLLLKSVDSVNSNNDVIYKRSNLDGIGINFNTEDYYDIKARAGINSFGGLAESKYSSNFEFNAVLVYYDLFDKNNEEDKVTNLFGVLFLDNYENSQDGWKIPTFKKVKPNKLLGNQGNSYGFKINLKYDTVTSGDVFVSTSVNDYNTFSMELFVDSLNELRETTRVFESNISKFGHIESEINELKSLVIDSENRDDILRRIERVENSLNGSNEIFSTSDDIIRLINNLRTEVNNIYENKTSLNIAYNLDVIKSGDGIKVEKTSDHFLKLHNNNESFNLSTNPRVLIMDDTFQEFPVFDDSDDNVYKFTHNLQLYSNWLKIMDGSPQFPKDIDRNIEIYIKDESVDWRAGQKMRISFKNGLNLNNTNGIFNITILTDFKDKLDTGHKYQAEIGQISSRLFDEHANRPIIEIICINPKDFTFEIDVF